jgi:hypothetical protein
MADEKRESPERPEENGRSGSDSAARTALRAAALAAGTTAVTAAARRAFSSGSGSSGGGSSRGTLMATLLAAWEAAQEHVLPPAEDAMEAIGRYLATDAPDVLRDRLVPRLVDGFETAREDEGGSSRSGD